MLLILFRTGSPGFFFIDVYYISHIMFNLLKAYRLCHECNPAPGKIAQMVPPLGRGLGILPTSPSNPSPRKSESLRVFWNEDYLRSGGDSSTQGWVVLILPRLVIKFLWLPWNYCILWFYSVLVFRGVPVRSLWTACFGLFNLPTHSPLPKGRGHSTFFVGVQISHYVWDYVFLASFFDERPFYSSIILFPWVTLRVF